MISFKDKIVLVIAPHLDDVELGMGGTLSRIARSAPKAIHYIGFSLPPNVKEEEYMIEF